MTYDLSKEILSPHDGSPRKKSVKGQIVDCDALDNVIEALEMPIQEREQNSEADINFRRKIVKKLKLAKASGTHNAVELKTKAVEEIKKRVCAYFIAGVAMQLLEIFDGEPTQAQLDDI